MANLDIQLKYASTNTTATAKKVEQKEEIAETSPDSSESCRTIIVRQTSTEAEVPLAKLWIMGDTTFKGVQVYTTRLSKHHPG